MPSLDSLKEEIHDVFMIFDEDESGSISIPELARALYTITGDRTPRSELLKLVAAARETIAKEEEEAARREEDEQRRHHQQQQQQQQEKSGKGILKSPSAGSAKTPGEGSARSGRAPQRQGNSDGVDAQIFERVVLRVMNSRSLEEELAFTFSLLEDRYYPGFITKESLKRAAADTDEPLTEAEVVEMFDAMVTGIPSAAVDFTTFCAVQAAARRLEDA